MGKRLIAAMVACLAVAGCGSDEKKTNGDEYSLTVFAYDAVTGAPIASADLAKGLVLYEGADKTQPTVLDTTLAGAVIFKDVPADYAHGNKLYPILANIAGYLPYQGYVSFSTNDNNFNNGSGDTVTGLPRDDLFAQVGNIYLFPVSFQTPSYTFTVMYGGLPVPNAVVEFDPARGTVTTDTDGSDVIWAADGHVQALSATTNASGKVTFAGSSLALGVTYKVTVLPVAFGGVQLSQNSPGNVAVGTAINDQVIPLTDLAPGTVNHGLYATNVTDANGTIAGDGALVITFNVPVVLNANNGGFAAAQAGTNGVLNTPSAIAVLTADGLTLKLTPNWLTPPTTFTPPSTVTYSGGSVSVQTYPADAIAVFGTVTTATGNAISGVVTIKAP
jgi:hypothetical protein